MEADADLDADLDATHDPELDASWSESHRAVAWHVMSYERMCLGPRGGGSDTECGSSIFIFGSGSRVASAADELRPHHHLQHRRRE